MAFPPKKVSSKRYHAECRDTAGTAGEPAKTKMRK